MSFGPNILVGFNGRFHRYKEVVFSTFFVSMMITSQLVLCTIKCRVNSEIRWYHGCYVRPKPLAYGGRFFIHIWNKVQSLFHDSLKNILFNIKKGVY